MKQTLIISGVTITLVPQTCAVCGCWFAIDQRTYQTARKTGCDFYCPQGHNLIFGENDAERALKELKEARAALDSERAYTSRLEHDLAVADREVKQGKQALRRLTRRAKAGVCPCCGRRFVQMARHMAAKHPDWGKEEAAPGQ